MFRHSLAPQKICIMSPEGPPAGVRLPSWNLTIAKPYLVPAISRRCMTPPLSLLAPGEVPCSLTLMERCDPTRARG